MCLGSGHISYKWNLHDRDLKGKQPSRIFIQGWDQKEGMGLLEYRTMPFLVNDRWRMAVYIYFIIAARNFASSQLGSSCKGNRYCTEKADGTTRPSRTKLSLRGHSPPARGGPPCWTSHLAFGLIGWKWANNDVSIHSESVASK